MEPVIWNRQTGNVVGGHQRLKVLVDMGQTEIDCVVVDLDLRREKGAQRRPQQDSGRLGRGKAGLAHGEFDATDFDVSLTGFEAGEVDALLNRFYSHEAQEDEFDADAAREQIAEDGGPVTQPGGLWALGEHRLLCADPTGPEAYERLLGKERAQCAVTSPPVDVKEYTMYGLEPWLKRMAQAIRLLARYAEVVCWQTADLMQTGSPFVEPLAMHAMKLFADETLRPLWIRVRCSTTLPTRWATPNAKQRGFGPMMGIRRKCCWIFLRTRRAGGGIREAGRGTPKILCIPSGALWRRVAFTDAKTVTVTIHKDGQDTLRSRRKPPCSAATAQTHTAHGILSPPTAGNLSGASGAARNTRPAKSFALPTLARLLYEAEN